MWRMASQLQAGVRTVIPCLSSVLFLNDFFTGSCLTGLGVRITVRARHTTGACDCSGSQRVIPGVIGFRQFF